MSIISATVFTPLNTPLGRSREKWWWYIVQFMRLKRRSKYKNCKCENTRKLGVWMAIFGGSNSQEVLVTSNNGRCFQTPWSAFKRPLSRFCRGLWGRCRSLSGPWKGFHRPLSSPTGRDTSLWPSASSLSSFVSFTQQRPALQFKVW